MTEKDVKWQTDLHRIILDSCCTLEELKFEWVEDQHFPILGGTVFPKLKQLQFHRDDDTGYAPLEAIGQAIAESFPCLEHLKI